MVHALVVGGTGMLKEASLYLNQQKWTTSVVARNQNRMNELINHARFPGEINPLLVDWGARRAFLESINRTIEENGPFDLILYWSAREVLNDVLKLNTTCHNGQWDLYHVKGSNASRPESRNIPRVPNGCHYHEIILGFQIVGNTVRWLTHGEISSGVIDAIKDKSKQKIIGTVEPWEMRPSW